MTQLEPVDIKIREYHSDGRIRRWIAQSLGISMAELDRRSTRMRLRRPQMGNQNSWPCANGHDVSYVGIRSGRCAKCGADATLPKKLMEHEGRVKRRFCHKGHDHAEVGFATVDSKPTCAACYAATLERKRTRHHEPKPLDSAATAQAMRSTESAGTVLDRILALEVQRETLPPYLRHEIDEQLRELRRLRA